jgi:cellulose synthase/poly-beta-1,6-N-acetylglucosamine synthase-like glycosyltransferase
MILLFWILFSLIIYTYLGYPLLLSVISGLRKRAIEKAEFFPFVSIIIAAYNEEDNIKNKIENSLRLDYPKEKLEIIIASDGSTDRTEEIVNSFKNARVKCLSFPERKGKTFAQNEAVKQVKGEIILFSDATTVYQPQLLRKIVQNFADTKVGAVGGELVYVNKNYTAISEGGGFYWKYEKFLKKKESQISSLIGVSGCCYALRKELYEPIRPDLISDFVIAQMLYKKGKRVIYEPEAISYEETNDTAADEFKMRVRVAVRTLYGILNMKSLLNPFRYGFFSLQLISHKILRYLAPLFLVSLFFVNLFICLTRQTIFYNAVLYLQLFFLSLVFLAWALKLKKKIFQIPFYFCLTNFALLVAIARFLRGERKVLWNPIRK